MQRLFQEHSCNKLDENETAELLLKYHLAKFFINQIYDENLTDDMEKDIYEFSVYWSNLYGDNGLVDYVSDFIDCSGSIDAITRKINTIVENNSPNKSAKHNPILTNEGVSLTYLKNFIEQEIDFDNMLVNSGLYETNAIAKHIGFDGIEDITIGVCFENSEAIGGPYEYNDGTVLEEFYTYNIFVGDEYINIFGGTIGSVEDRLPESTLALIRKEILDFADIVL